VTRRRRLAWCGLTWAVALFPLGQLGLAVALERDRLPVRDPEFARKLTRLDRLRRAHPGQPVLLALGSSRLLQGLRADRLDGLPGPDGRPGVGFNFGLTAAGPVRQWLALQRLLDLGYRPDRLLVEVTPVFLNEPGDGRFSEECWFSARRLARGELERAKPYLTRPARLAQDWLGSRVLPGYGYRGGWSERLLPPGGRGGRPERMDRRGWDPYPVRVLRPDDRRLFVDMSLRQYASVFADFRVGRGPARALADLRERCRREAIPVTLLLLPEASEFRERLGPAGEAELGRLLDEVTRSDGCGVIDARDWLADWLFWDGHHLRCDGATVFSRRLRDALAGRAAAAPFRPAICDPWSDPARGPRGSRGHGDDLNAEVPYVVGP
jgi:hypothetical protein